MRIGGLGSVASSLTNQW